ncbi:MAG: class I SAM-dependent methyltransferase [Candidatus Magasanikbacteria bacterium]|nr:class I SAM-dependent methyltransferase [Candidatus Magasanikbacteria bacterium]
MSNLYDNLVVDIAAKHREINSDPAIKSDLAHKRGLARSFADKLFFYFKIYERLIDSGWYRAWFNEFDEYWIKALGGRKLYFHDFFFLYSSYRTKFQEVGAGEHIDRGAFLRLWQDPRNVYSIFGAVYKYSLSPFHYWPFRRYLRPGDRVLEYGCGIAPITTGLLNDGKDAYHFTIADIPQFTYHYAKWRLRQFGVKWIDIDPAALPALEAQYDAVFLCTVLEHLPNPRAVVEHLTAHIKIGGYLMFDYFLGDGEGLDTIEAVEQRGAVLDYLKANYTMVRGELKYKESMGRTVIQKKT